MVFAASHVRTPPVKTALPSVAFYYGENPPVDVLRDFDWVVVDPSAMPHPDVLATRSTRVFAYVSLGEMEKDSASILHLPASCRIGVDKIWNSILLDQSRVSCRDWFIAHIVQPLLKKGYRNFFFDTLDSYKLASTKPVFRVHFRRSLITLIKTIHGLDPDGRFILNRGFRLLPALRDQGVVAVAAESLYRGWDEARHRYIKIAPEDTHWLVNQLEKVRELGLVAIAIDYLHAHDHTRSVKLARRIEHLGIVPYVTNAHLDIVGASTITPIARKILLLYNGPYKPMNNNLDWYAAISLNYMGYATHEINVSHQPLLSGPLTGQVAGIVTWFNNDHFPASHKTWVWLKRQIQAGVPVAVLGQWGFPTDASHLRSLGLITKPMVISNLVAAHIISADKHFFGFESPVLPSVPDFYPLKPLHGKPLLVIKLKNVLQTASALTSWGGYVLDPYVLRNLPQGSLRENELQAAWILDPFTFFRAALRLPIVPAYDTTTQSGRRLLFGLIDGDGFASHSWIPRYRDQFAAKVTLDAVLKRFHLPVTASVIASEFTTPGLYPPRLVKQLRPIARAIFRLPWVEIGSHTYSHPFDWPALEKNPGLSAGLHLKPGVSPIGTHVGGNGPALKYGYNLPVPGYRFSPQMEVTGSTHLIDHLLAPPGKRVRIIQWSGDTNPNAQVLKLAYSDGLANINGYNGTIDRAHPSLTNVAPLGVWKGPYFQVFSPIANEDQYTHGWQPPYCGYAKAIQTMKMTNRPRRLAPMEIYYHFYSGARTCALKNLIEVYQWAQKQPSTPVFASIYSHTVIDFEHAGLARNGRAFIMCHYGLNQEIRIPETMGYPDLARSVNIAGFDDFDGRRYIHLGPGGTVALLWLAPKPPRQPYLRSTNGLIEGLERRPGWLRLSLRAEAPLQASLARVRGCEIQSDGKTLIAHSKKTNVNIDLLKHHATIIIDCKY